MRKKIFLLLLICFCSYSVWADPTSSGAENAATIPPDCNILGEYYGQGVQKCVKDQHGATKCFIAKVSCCGNGRIDGPLTDSSTGELISTQETCEMGSAGCRSDCTLCGDGIVNIEHAETCDLGLRNGLVDSGCTAACTIPVCGNGVYEVSNSGEDCDGDDFSDRYKNLPIEPTCDDQCKVHFCGDGKKDSNELCDGTDRGSVNNAAAVCNSSCQFDPYCGDGIKNGNELCDGSDLGTVTDPDARCNSSCGFDPYCGDGIKNNREICDQADLGIVTDSDASCSASCQLEPYCGDGIKNGSEACDGKDRGGITDVRVSCSPECTINPYCGDGIQNATEACDGQDRGLVTNANASCNSTCKFNPYCGDGTVQASYRVGRTTIKETCDDGNNNENDGCASNCHFECRWYRATASYIDFGTARKAVVGKGFDLNELPCLATFLGDNYQSILTRQGNSRNNGINATWTDDRLILKMLAYVYSQLPECSANYDACHGALDGFIGDTYEVDQVIDPAELARANAARTYIEQVLGKFNCSVEGRCTDDKLRALLNKRKLAFDGSCNLITLPDDFHAEQICGTVSIRAFASPISLIFDTKQAAHEDRKLVQFALNPSNPNSWALWRATTNNPLLVLLNSDGEVEQLDGSSLFGNWTSGGQSSLLIQTTFNKNLESRQKTAWLNGFEALAALDNNLDGEISRAELDKIGLWFDRNQNAKLDPNELESLEKNGVKRLFYKYDSVDSESQDTFASLGYERELDGNLVKGAALDWFTQTYNTATEALAVGISNSVNSSSKADQDTNEIVEQKVNTSNVSGTWVWGMRTKTEQILPLGVLFLDEQAGGVLSGESLSEQVLSKQQSKGLSSIVMPIKLTGTVTGDDSIEFGLVSKDGNETSSSGKIVRPGVMEGSSEMSSNNGNGPKASQRVSYDWVAVKIAQ